MLNNKIIEKKDWIYDENRCYNNYIGKKVYISTIWDNNNLNLLNYGRLKDINNEFITIDVGCYKFKNLKNLTRINVYSNKQIKHIYIKVTRGVDIKKEYKRIKYSKGITGIEREYMYKNLIECNFNYL